MTLAWVVNHIVNVLQFGKYSIYAYSEFSKPPDTLNHDTLFGAKPLPKPMLVYCQFDYWEQMSVKLE